MPEPGLGRSDPVRPCRLPDDALLRRYLDGGHYVDCFATRLPGCYCHTDYVAAFYTTRLFKLERLILSIIGRPSCDDDATRLALGTASRFAAWDVEDRTANQLLLRDFTGRTRSWLMTAPGIESGVSTLLYFGSAVMGSDKATDAASRPSPPFRPLLGFHRRYSTMLLAAARKRLERTQHAFLP